MVQFEVITLRQVTIAFLFTTTIGLTLDAYVPKSDPKRQMMMMWFIFFVVFTCCFCCPFLLQTHRMARFEQQKETIQVESMEAGYSAVSNGDSSAATSDKYVNLREREQDSASMYGTKYRSTEIDLSNIPVVPTLASMGNHAPKGSLQTYRSERINEGKMY